MATDRQTHLNDARNILMAHTLGDGDFALEVLQLLGAESCLVDNLDCNLRGIVLVNKHKHASPITHIPFGRSPPPGPALRRRRCPCRECEGSGIVQLVWRPAAQRASNGSQTRNCERCELPAWCVGRGGNDILNAGQASAQATACAYVHAKTSQSFASSRYVCHHRVRLLVRVPWSSEHEPHLLATETPMWRQSFS